MTVAEYRRLSRRKASAKRMKGRSGTARGVTTKKWEGPNKTELRYARTFLEADAQYEADHLPITESEKGIEEHHYTPDWRSRIVAIMRSGTARGVTIKGDEATYLVNVWHEVKGSYRLQSQDAARLRFIFASIHWPTDYFVWAKERKDKSWDIEFVKAGVVVAKATKVTKYVAQEVDGKLEVVWQRLG